MTGNHMTKDAISARTRIGMRIAATREECRMTQNELAAKTGLRQAHISRIECGTYSVGFDTLEKIAQAMGKKVDLV